MLRRSLAHRPLLQASLAVLTALFVGCGGKVVVDGTGVGGGGGAGGAGSTSSSSVTSNSTGTAQGTGGVSTGPNPSTSTGPMTSTGTDVTATSTGTGPDTTATSTGSGDATATSTGAGGSAPVPQVFCNNQPCNDAEICCFNLTMPTDFCGQAGDCGDGYIELACNGPEDCPNSQICCAHIQQNQGMVPYTGIACEDTCEGMDTRIVCGSAGSAVCNPGDSCKNSQTLGAGYKVCRP